VFVISGFHHYIHKVCDLLRYYAAYSGNSLRMFWDNLSVPKHR